MYIIKFKDQIKLESNSINIYFELKLIKSLEKHLDHDPLFHPLRIMATRPAGIDIPGRSTCTLGFIPE